MRNASISSVTFAALIYLSAAGPAEAYVGPGAGMGLVSAFLALAAVVGLSLVMTFLYPLRALYRKLRGQSSGEAEDSAPSKPSANQEDKAP